MLPKLNKYIRQFRDKIQVYICFVFPYVMCPFEILRGKLFFFTKILNKAKSHLTDTDIFKVGKPTLKRMRKVDSQVPQFTNTHRKEFKKHKVSGCIIKVISLKVFIPKGYTHCNPAAVAQYVLEIPSLNFRFAFRANLQSLQGHLPF